MDSILAEREQTAGRRRPPEPTSHDSGERGTGSGARRAQVPVPFFPADIDLRLLAKALTIRRTEERLLELFAEGKLSGTVHTCIGQEWVGVAVAEALKPGDYLFSNHRCHGHYLAWTDDVDGLIAEIMGRSTGVCGGRGGSQHLCRDGFFSNGVQGGIAPVSAGLAMAQQIKDNQGIAAVFLGDGTFGQGVVYETLNIAAKWRLPLLFVVEDNGISQSTEQSETLTGTIGARAKAFGIEIRTSDTWHPEELIQRANEAASWIRQTGQPLLLQVKTYRLKAHSKGDDDRDPAEVAEFAERDTINQIIAENSSETQKVLAAIDRRLDEAVERASKSAFASIGNHNKNPQSQTPPKWKPIRFEQKRILEAIRNTLDENMSADERIILLGEDIRDPYGGAFKVTAGLSEKHGHRVRNTPISESAIVGIGNGLAMAGLRPIVEIMFGDFLTLAADQIINHAAKFAWMYNNQIKVPIIIRTPMGGYRGYGPTHSQSLEKHFLGLPGTQVLALHKRYCPALLYDTLLKHVDRPTLVIENKLLYSQRSDSTPPEGCELTVTDHLFPTVRIAPPGERQITIVTYGGMTAMAEAAMAELEDEDLACDLLIPTQLYPLDIEPIAESVRQTGRLLVVEEGQGFAGFGSELIAQLAADCKLANFHAKRVHAAACPIPSSKPAEQEVLPDVEQIVSAAIELIDQ